MTLTRSDSARTEGWGRGTGKGAPGLLITQIESGSETRSGCQDGDPSRVIRPKAENTVSIPQRRRLLSVAGEEQGCTRTSAARLNPPHPPPRARVQASACLTPHTTHHLCDSCRRLSRPGDPEQLNNSNRAVRPGAKPLPAVSGGQLRFRPLSRLEGRSVDSSPIAGKKNY